MVVNIDIGYDRYLNIIFSQKYPLLLCVIFNQLSNISCSEFSLCSDGALGMPS